ncbi:helix-turn-helix transcriptional regulator [Streptomyces lavendulocolor]|uniref:helix-turn-helix transcriptional regulator n=1 Tax=Streptomyces lavendulocolor TaxID=67316 RepID=UPI003C2D1658
MRHKNPATEDVAIEPKFLDAAEVAVRLRVSRSTVYNLIDSGRLPAHRMGGGKIRPRGLRVLETAVDAYLSGSLVTPSTKAVA